MAAEQDSLFLPDPEKRYTVYSHEAYVIIAGIIGESQVLVFPTGGAFLVLYFDSQGSRTESATVPIDPGKGGRKSLAEWLGSQGFCRMPISIRRFYIPDINCGIKDIPDSMRKAVEHPERFHPAEAAEIRQMAVEWIRDGMFVLCWGEDYYMDSSGSVISS